MKRPLAILLACLAAAVLLVVGGGFVYLWAEADTVLQRLGFNAASERLVTGILVTDTVPIDPRARPDNLTVLTVSGLLAETIMNVFADDSVSAIFGGENQLF